MIAIEYFHTHAQTLEKEIVEPLVIDLCSHNSHMSSIAYRRPTVLELGIPLYVYPYDSQLISIRSKSLVGY